MRDFEKAHLDHKLLFEDWDTGNLIDSWEKRTRNECLLGYLSHYNGSIFKIQGFLSILSGDKVARIETIDQQLVDIQTRLNDLSLKTATSLINKSIPGQKVRSK